MRKPIIENKYNLTIEDLTKLKVGDRSKIKEPLFWRNNNIKAWCISGNTIRCKSDELYNTYNSFQIIVNDNSDIINISVDAYGGMTWYNFKEFFNYNEIEYGIDLEIQEKLLEKINFLIDEGILILENSYRLDTEKVANFTWKIPTWEKSLDNKYLPFTIKNSNIEDFYKRGYWVGYNLKIIKISEMSERCISDCIKKIRRYCRENNVNPCNYIVYINLLEECTKKLKETSLKEIYDVNYLWFGKWIKN